MLTKICSNKECELVGQGQPLENFFRDKDNKDGLHTQCKKCFKKKTQKRILGYTNTLADTVEDITQICSSSECEYQGIPQPIENFGKDRTYKGGRKTQCKKCMTLKAKERTLFYINNLALDNSERLATKICGRSDCSFNGQPQPIQHFYKSKYTKDGFYQYCRKCAAIMKMIQKYPGITKSIALDVIEKRAHCLICGTSEDLHIDHCHTTKRFRAIMCGKHNQALGLCDENPEEIRRLARYAEHCQRHKEKYLQEQYEQYTQEVA